MASSWTTPASWTSGVVLTAAKMITEVTDHMDWLGEDKPNCRLTHSANQNVPTGTGSETVLAFNTEVHKTVAGMHNTVTNNSRIIFPVDGTYLIGGSISYSGVTVSDGRAAIRLNAGNKLAISTTQDQYVTVSTLYQANATDYVQLLAYQVSGGALNAETVADYSPIFWAVWLGV